MAGIYPHWLDSESFRIPGRTRDIPGRLIEARRSAKIHALLGTKLEMHDQAFDSLGILHLFDDAEFLQFLRHNPDFLTLVVPVEAADRGDRFSIVMAGLKRSLRPTWASGLNIRDPEPIRELTRAILEDGSIALGYNSSGVEAVMQRWPACAQKLSGICTLAGYFAEDGSYVRDVPNSDLSYLDVLVGLEKRDDLTAEHRDVLEATIDRVMREIPDERDRRFRSALLKRLSLQDRRDWAIWRTAVAGWDCAAHQTMQTSGSSIRGIEEVPHAEGYEFGVTSGHVFDATLDSTGLDALPMPVDIDALRWSDIRQICEETASTRDALRAASGSGSSVEHCAALKAHALAISTLVVDHYKPLSEKPWGKLALWVAEAAGAAAGVYLHPLDPKTSAVAGFTTGKLVVEGTHDWIQRLRWNARVSEVADAFRRQTPEETEH